jgi:hypothetical protein
MPTHWGSRMRRGMVTQNHRWQATGWARLWSLFTGGHGLTPSEQAQANEQALRGQKRRATFERKHAEFIEYLAALPLSIEALNKTYDTTRQLTTNPTMRAELEANIQANLREVQLLRAEKLLRQASFCCQCGSPMTDVACPRCGWRQPVS